MDVHFAVLPLDVVDSIVARLSDSDGVPHFLRLSHPRTGVASLFLALESALDGDEPDRKRISKILEVQAVEPPNARSWFMDDEVISDGKLLVMTPIDPLFLLIPILGMLKQPGSAAGNFRPAEDMFEDASRRMAEASVTSAAQDASSSVSVEDVNRFAALECTRNAMRRVCDVKEITSEITVFRYSPEKLLQELRRKATTLSTPRIAEMSRCLVRSLAKDALMDDKNEDLLELGRTKMACDLLAQYLPHDVHETLLGSYDWTRLDTHLKALAKEQTLLSTENTVTSKKSGGDPESKKRKKESKGSQGVEKLRKANVSGMSRLSTFFTKTAK